MDFRKKVMNLSVLISMLLFFLLIVGDLVYLVNASQAGTRPLYVYDRANIVSPYYEDLLNDYSRQVDETTSVEIIVYTIPGFVGHGVTKDGIEIQDRDALSNFIFNELPLDGIKGIGKQGTNNGILLLFSPIPDPSGGSMRIEVGRGLEGNITDGIAGEILDTYLVPAKESFEQNRNITAIGNGLLDTVVALGVYSGYISNDSKYKLSDKSRQQDSFDFFSIIIFVVVFAVVLIAVLRKRGNNWFQSRRYGGSGWYGGSGGRSGFGSSFGSGSSWSRGGSGGGGFSSGGGAGR